MVRWSRLAKGHPARLKLVAAAENQELPRQGGAQLRGALHVAEHGGGLGRDAPVLQGQGGVSHDDRQDVVEIVGHAAGQEADRFHALGVPQLLFHALPLGDVLHQRDEAALARYVGEFAVVKPLPQRALLGAEHDALVAHGAALFQQGDDAGAVGGIAPEGQLGNGAAHRLLPAPAEIPDEAVVDVEQPSLGHRRDGDGVGIGPEGLGEFVLRLQESSLGRALVRDVPQPGQEIGAAGEVEAARAHAAEGPFSCAQAMRHFHLVDRAGRRQLVVKELPLLAPAPKADFQAGAADDLAARPAHQPAESLVDLPDPAAGEIGKCNRIGQRRDQLGDDLGRDIGFGGKWIHSPRGGFRAGASSGGLFGGLDAEVSENSRLKASQTPPPASE